MKRYLWIALATVAFLTLVVTVALACSGWGSGGSGTTWIPGPGWGGHHGWS